MKKSILFGCLASTIFTASVALAADPGTAIQNAFSNLLKNQVPVSAALPTTVTVIPDGENFNVTLSDPENPALPERTLHLIRAGEFNGHPQYQIEAALDHVFSFLRETVPGISISTQSVQSTLIWVPEYNLITKNSYNIRGVQVSTPDTGTFSFGQSVLDSLAQITGPDKMNRASIQDVSDILITTDNLTISVPSFSYQDSLTGVTVSDNVLTQLLSSEDTRYRMSIPTLFLTSAGESTPLASLAVATAGSYKDDVFHWELQLNDIVIDSDLYTGVPGTLIPSQVSLDFDISGLDHTKIQSLFNEGDTLTQDNLREKVMQLVQNIVVHINRTELKNADGGIAVSGTIRDISEQKLPQVDLTVAITNLDKLSPMPTVDQARCDEATARLNAVDVNDPNADSQKRAASFAVAQACQSQGGVLDDLRPFIVAEKRETQPDGTTLDTIQLQLKDGDLYVNGQPLVDLDTMMGLDTDEPETDTVTEQNTTMGTLSQTKAE